MRLAEHWGGMPVLLSPATLPTAQEELGENVEFWAPRQLSTASQTAVVMC